MRRKGSPPRGRGKVVLTEHHHAAKRITPAWAGKSRAHGASSCGEKDHPRVGGEKPTSCAPCPGRSGSPPRGRGKGPRPGNTPVLTRITPAWAGKRRDWPAAQHGPRDHPRVGGEKCLMSWSCALLTGSPPRGRGKATFSGRCGPGVGITPAWAGKRRGVFSTPRTAGDHPRVGGEKGGGFVCYRCHWGSPPRGRGKGPSLSERRH